MGDHEHQPSSLSDPLEPGHSVPLWLLKLLAKCWWLIGFEFLGLLSVILLIPFAQGFDRYEQNVQAQVAALLALPTTQPYVAGLLVVVIPMLAVASYLAHRTLVRQEESKQQRKLLRSTLNELAKQLPAVPRTLSEQNRVRMLRRLRHSYEQLFAESLEGVALLELGLSQQPDAVQNAAMLLFRRAQRAEQLLPPGTSIMKVFNESAQELLILGDPGSGKSTLLLQLAQALVGQAEQHETEPLPVIVPLASWAAHRPPLEDWLVEQTALVYGIDERVARPWVEADQLLPLLDGLDEMEATAQPSCIEAINTYHQKHPRPLVVCSRTADYEEASNRQRLFLQSAVEVQPLAPAQVDAYLAQAGQPLEALGRALKKNAVLRDLASTPLMLNVLMLTYQGKSVRFVVRKKQEVQRQVWTDYVQMMVERKGNRERYPLERTCAWLHWLAGQMRKHSQTIFYLEHLQPDWLPASVQRAYSWFAIRIPGILVGMLAGLSVSLIFSLISYGLVALLQNVLLGGFLGGLFSEGAAGARSQNLTNSLPLPMHCRLLQYAALSIGIGLAFGLSFGFNLIPGYYLFQGYGLNDWLRDGGIFGGGIGLSCWVLLAVWPRLSARQRRDSAAYPARRLLDMRRLLDIVLGQRGLLVGAMLAGGYSLSFILDFRVLPSMLTGGLSTRVLLFYLIDVLGLGLIFFLVYGLMGVFINLILERQTSSVLLTERLNWTWGSLIRGLINTRHLHTMLVLFLSVSIVDTLGGSGAIRRPG